MKKGDCPQFCRSTLDFAVAVRSSLPMPEIREQAEDDDISPLGSWGDITCRRPCKTACSNDAQACAGGASFVPQGLHRIDLRGTQGRNKTGAQRYECQSDRRSDKHRGVGLLELIEQRLCIAAER
jgi:hypothetical protein